MIADMGRNGYSTHYYFYYFDIAIADAISKS